MKSFDPTAVTLGSVVIVKQFQGSTISSGRYLAKMEDGRHVVEMVAMNGTHFANVFDERDVFIPPTKRTVYVNLYRQENPVCAGVGMFAVWHDDQNRAARNADEHNAIAIAVPIEIED